MTDKEMADKKGEYFERFDHEPINIEYIWDWIEELIKEVEKKKILEEFDEGFVDESDVWKTKKEWEMEEDKGFLFKDNKLIPIKKGFKLKTGKDQRVTKFKLGRDN